jgi:5-methylcytosine-specific restriction protein A
MRQRKAPKIYHGRRWKHERTHYIKQHPFCVMCEAQGKVRQAFAVDHIIPHKGDPVLMWDQSNWQSLCEGCHNRAKRNIEIRGYSLDVGPDGFPLDPRHPAHTSSRKIFTGGEVQ